MALHIHAVKATNYDRFLEEARKAREDFEAIKNTDNQRHIEATLEKYENFIEYYYDPYASLRKRVH